MAQLILQLTLLLAYVDAFLAQSLQRQPSDAALWSHCHC